MIRAASFLIGSLRAIGHLCRSHEITTARFMGRITAIACEDCGIVLWERV